MLVMGLDGTFHKTYERWLLGIKLKKNLLIKCDIFETAILFSRVQINIECWLTLFFFFYNWNITIRPSFISFTKTN